MSQFCGRLAAVCSQRTENENEAAKTQDSVIVRNSRKKMNGRSARA
ncbi:hypothetical protein BIFPSEUDO_02887 [Bifidobacterium pseudocatenulatum DSM 20438 = JCM 1200 = LMG 10505]|uniref:Uncharacterized protein n=1 Tax=Bifidobacterium pseudocatenulatum DSM 20438 = JCM 1200 = LMG 10505 TaxID=547043 RepID=C0BR80_BIFPS|nr:hypothetical protein BIFPSEUDO_02887 [Bifidobacterium pseudocatenulatum DSM 20438 = JCM 1200 = LMG 10505]BAR02799.1 conserved hypothetical protein [Bifidobacterium pseudocatenulatum DSM 20438 = JCM 1200 = LMG 10505]